MSVLCAIALGGIWYIGAILLAPDAVAQPIAVIGALVVSALVSVVTLNRGIQMLERVATLGAAEGEVWIIDRQSGRISYRNRAAQERIDAAEAIEIVPADQRNILSSMLHLGSVSPCCLLRIGGKIFRPSITSEQGTHLVMLVLRDITQEIADQRIKDDFISTVSHELRSPLTSIKGAMGLLLSNATGELPEPARNLLEISHRNAERLVVILNDILDLQKIADDGMVFDSKPVDASALVHEAIAASSLYMQRFDLTVDVIGAQSPVVFESDPNRIMQVLGNLLTNAAKFSRLHSTITVIVEEDADWITIRVRDQGEGIGPDDQKKIFERFADLANSDRQKKGGSGLGLSISKAIVDRLGGSIGFESIEGVGTTFSFHLPKGYAVETGLDVETKLRDAG